MLDAAPKTARCQFATIERRSRTDRRQNRLSSLFWRHPERRRRHVRRKADKKRFFLLDYYQPFLLFWVIIVLVLSLTDATLTLWLISIGAEELNPVMDHFLKLGPTAFVISKYSLTAFSLVVVVLLQDLWRHRLGLSMHGLLYGFAGLFFTVVLWQIFLLRVWPL